MVKRNELGQALKGMRSKSNRFLDELRMNEDSAEEWNGIIGIFG